MILRHSLLLAALSLLLMGCSGPSVPLDYTVMVQNGTGGEIGEFAVNWGPLNSDGKNILNGKNVLAGEGRFTDPPWMTEKIAIPETFTVTWTMLGQQTEYCATFTIAPESINERVTNFTIDLKPGHATCKIVVKAKSGPGSTFSDPIPVKMTSTKPPVEPTVDTGSDTTEPDGEMPSAPSADTATP